MDRLASYTPKGPKDGAVQVLTAFLDNLPADGREALANDLCDFSDEEVWDLADSLVKHLLLPMRALRVSSNVSPSPRPGMEDSVENVASEMDDPVVRVAALKKECLRRDGHKCAITGLPDEDSGSVSCVATQCAHIVPFSLATWRTDQEADSKATVWVNLRRCFPVLRRMDFTYKSINNHGNAISMWADVHDHFGKFLLAFEETDVEHTYRVKKYKANMIWHNFVSPTVTFTQHDDRYALPDPELLRVHACIARILHASGKAEEIEKIIRDRDALGGLAKDGGTEIAKILQATTLGPLEGYQQQSQENTPPAPIRGDKAKNRMPGDRPHAKTKENIKD